jgi:hypothetical protein
MDIQAAYEFKSRSTLGYPVKIASIIYNNKGTGVPISLLVKRIFMPNIEENERTMMQDHKIVRKFRFFNKDYILAEQSFSINTPLFLNVIEMIFLSLNKANIIDHHLEFTSDKTEE